MSTVVVPVQYEYCVLCQYQEGPVRTRVASRLAMACLPWASQKKGNRRVQTKSRLRKGRNLSLKLSPSPWLESIPGSDGHAAQAVELVFRSTRRRTGACILHTSTSNYRAYRMWRKRSNFGSRTQKSNGACITPKFLYSMQSRNWLHIISSDRCCYTFHDKTVDFLARYSDITYAYKAGYVIEQMLMRQVGSYHP